MSGEFQSITGRARVVTVCLVVIGIIGAASVLSYWAQFDLLERMGSGDFRDSEIDDNDTRVRLLAGADMLARFICAIAFIVWMHRAYRNLDALRSFGKQYSAGWTIGAWFIPIGNLWMPYRVMQEIWAKTDSDGQRTALIWQWWGAYLLMSVLGQVAGRLPVDNLADARTSTEFALAHSVVSVLAVAVAIRLVWGLTARQERAPRSNAGTAEVFA